MGRPRLATNLVATFRRARVLTLDELGRRLSVSRSTALRRLAEHGYFSSYNVRGEFLTIEEAADFDSRGLWVFKKARFSRCGTLKKTVEHFVSSSDAGMTHEELSELLGVRLHNPLLALTQESVLHRERIGSIFVYLNPAARVRRAQIRARLALASRPTLPRPTNQQIIATLLTLVREPRASREEIVLRCQRAGVTTSLEVVDAVFSKYDLAKKRAP